MGRGAALYARLNNLRFFVLQYILLNRTNELKFIEFFTFFCSFRIVNFRIEWNELRMNFNLTPPLLDCKYIFLPCLKRLYFLEVRCLMYQNTTIDCHFHHCNYEALLMKLRKLA